MDRAQYKYTPLSLTYLHKDLLPGLNKAAALPILPFLGRVLSHVFRVGGPIATTYVLYPEIPRAGYTLGITPLVRKLNDIAYRRKSDLGYLDDMFLNERITTHYVPFKPIF